MTRRPLAAAAALAAALAVPAVAQADGGTTALTLKGAAATSLSGQGVKVGAVAPATAKGKVITFPVVSVTVGTRAALGHKGGLRLRANGRTLTLTTPKLALAGTGSKLTAKVGATTTTILTVDAAKRSLNATAGSVALNAGRVRLTAAGAKAIKRVLKLKRLRAGVLGTLTVDAKKDSSTTTGGSGQTTPGGGPTGGGGTGTGGTGTGGSGGGSGGGGATGCTAGTATAPGGGPAELARPGSAVDVTAGAITWHVRDSFIQYINTGEGTKVSGGATADPATVQPGSSVPLVYQFRFPFKSGWHDPVSNTTRLTYSGTVTFCYSGHGIRLTASNPEVEINGSSSRAIFVTGNTGEADTRGVLVKLDPAAAASIVHSPDGKEHAWNQVPGAIPADAGESVFAGFYGAGDPFGWITATATTP
jgi:hypothetical protein